MDQLFEAFADESRRRHWLPDGRLRERTATKSKSIRFDWAGGETRVNVGFIAKGDAASTVSLEHARLVDADEAGSAAIPDLRETPRGGQGRRYQGPWMATVVPGE